MPQVLPINFLYRVRCNSQIYNYIDAEVCNKDSAGDLRFFLLFNNTTTAATANIATTNTTRITLVKFPKSEFPSDVLEIVPPYCCTIIV